MTTHDARSSVPFGCKVMLGVGTQAHCIELDPSIYVINLKGRNEVVDTYLPAEISFDV